MGGGSSQRDPQSLHDSGRTPLARERVVHRPSLSADPTTSGASLVGPVVAAAPLQQAPQRRPHAEPSCVATLQRAFREDLLWRCPAASIHPLPGCTRQSGFSVVGVVEGALLQSTPLYP